MCNSCVKKEYPDRESICLDSGSYMVNFAGCAQCGESNRLAIVNKQTSEDEDEVEMITYQHICEGCHHIVANHEHTFCVEDRFQMYEMMCVLCGSGADQRSVLPFDPRGPRTEQ